MCSPRWAGLLIELGTAPGACRAPPRRRPGRRRAACRKLTRPHRGSQVPDGSGGRAYKVLKLLSEDPANYPDAPREGIRRILEQVTGACGLAGAPGAARSPPSRR
jgi:hypothetical protein